MKTRIIAQILVTMDDPAISHEKRRRLMEAGRRLTLGFKTSQESQAFMDSIQPLLKP